MLSALHVHVRWVMCASIAAAFTLCLTVQHQPLADVLRCMLTGYAAPEQSLLAACYLYLIPLCSLVRKLLRRRRVAA